MHSRRYPPLLPALSVSQDRDPSSSTSDSPAGNNSSSRNTSEQEQDRARRQSGVSPRPRACTECRARKTKCDGRRPMCSHCLKRGLTTCIYPEKSGATPEVGELLELLQSQPEDRAVTLLGLLRAKSDITSVLTVFKGGGASKHDHVLSKREEDAADARNFLVSELMAKHPTAYPSWQPVSASKLGKSDLVRPTHPPTEEDTIDSSCTSAPPSPPGRQFRLPHVPTATSADIEYWDEGLRRLDIAFWTDLPVTSDFAARVISLYLEADHPLLGLFDPHLFIADLVEQRDVHCSRFLLHAILYLGCQMYSAFEEDTILLATTVRETAEELWKAEPDSFPAMAGSILLSLALMGHGKDHAVLHYAAAALKMGQRLGCFSPKAHGSLTSLGTQSPMADSSLNYAAWGIFNYNVLLSMFYRQPGSEICVPKSAPFSPILEVDSPPQHSAGAVLERDVKKQAPKRIFPALCRFWQIVHRVRWIYYDVPGRPVEGYRLPLAEHVFRELLAWAETLPSDLLRGQERSHHVAVIHIWFHSVVLDIFRPFLENKSDLPQRLTTFTARDSSPQSAHTASVRQLKLLVVEYRSKYLASAYSFLWHTGLIYLTNGVLKDTDDPEWRNYVTMCIYGYECLVRPYRISESIGQGLLTMTMRNKNMSGTEALQIMRDLQRRGLHNVGKEIEGKIRAPFMADLDLAQTDPESASVETMADKFEDLVLFQDLINQDMMEM
ncbi:hypothetical protein F4780DRAFT_773036 [Xylariomycetidae sp. FL0641]|nr:hypothetical protein F4780DRAFT_773036 [Xylariomycetidae sp. FL0641]